MATKDWTGNSKAVHSCLGASNHSETEREIHDYYATPPIATEMLCKIETFSKDILEPCCGEGHIAKVLEAHGYNVESMDLIDRGYGKGGVDFLKYNEPVTLTLTMSLIAGVDGSDGFDGEDVDDGLAAVELGIFLKTGIINVYSPFTAPISSNVFLKVCPSF